MLFHFLCMCWDLSRAQPLIAAQREKDLSAPAGSTELIMKLTLITGFEGARAEKVEVYIITG